MLRDPAVMHIQSGRPCVSITESEFQVVPVILSGGSGTRLWPRSRKTYPKQLHNLYGDYTMLQHTLNRVNQYEAPIVVCNNDQRFMVADQLRALGKKDASIILEPMAKNTAPAIIAAAYYAQKKYTNPILVVLAADHLIQDLSAFQQAMSHAINAARKNKLVAFGVVPSKPETGYGYIQAESNANPAGTPIVQFVEKPDLKTAERYLAAGNYTWNSGMFVFPVNTLMDEMDGLQVSWLSDCKLAVEEAEIDSDFVRLSAGAFSQCTGISIDFALMEKTEKAWMVPLDAGWSDLGSWESLWESSDKDSSGNAVSGDAFVKNCKNSLIHAQGKLIAAIGLENIVIVESDDALLVVDRTKTQDVKDVVDWLQEKNRAEYMHHRKVHQPWGKVDSVVDEKVFQVKSIEVKPGEGFSPAIEHQSAKHWIVVSGTALVQFGDEEKTLSGNESIYISGGQKHRLCNLGAAPLHMIEVRGAS